MIRPPWLCLCRYCPINYLFGCECGNLWAIVGGKRAKEGRRFLTERKSMEFTVIRGRREGRDCTA